MVGSAGRGVASPCSTISSCVTAVCDVEVVVGAGPWPAAGLPPSAATITPQHNFRTDTNASLFRTSRLDGQQGYALALLTWLCTGRWSHRSIIHICWLSGQ